MNKPKLKKQGYGKCKQGHYKVKNKKKYIGDSENVIFRSGLELNAFRYFDMNENVKKFGSEIIHIPYFDRSTNQNRTYITDIYAEYIDKNGEIIKAVIEVKPKKQTQAPSKKGKNYQNRYNEYVKNVSKWDAARKWSEAHGMKFFLLTEEQLK